MNPDNPAIAFFGTSDIAVQALEHLHEADLTPALIVTAPDRPKGRGLALSPSPVKEWALLHGIPVIEPEALGDIPPELEKAPSGEPWDVFVVVSYGRMIPRKILDLPLRGALNVHPSLLPKLRGPSPLESAILEDMRETGVTIMLLDEEMDHGPIVSQARITVEDWPPKALMLEKLLGDVGGELLVEAIVPWINGDIMEEKQDDDVATYTRKFTKEDGLIDLSGDPYANFRKIQAFSERPGTYFFVYPERSRGAEKNLPAPQSKASRQAGGKKIRVKIADAEYLPAQAGKGGVLTITRVIPEGKKEMDYEDFRRGLK